MNRGATILPKLFLNPTKGILTIPNFVLQGENMDRLIEVMNQDGYSKEFIGYSKRHN